MKRLLRQTKRIINNIVNGEKIYLDSLKEKTDQIDQNETVED